MAFPLTHLIVAMNMIKSHNIEDEADFLLGSIAPDAVHYRKSFVGASMSEIGQAKKISHLCPVSDEKWGSVTDNEGWQSCVKMFLQEHEKTSFRVGYATHVLTDIFNNKTIWNDFRTNHPSEAIKGYKSAYYDDLRHIDTLLNDNRAVIELICEKLAQAEAVGITGLVSSDEVEAIKQTMIYEYGNVPQIGNYDKFYATKFVSYDKMLIFVKEAVLYASAIVF